MSVIFSEGTTNHVFQNPELGNVDEISFQRTTNKTRGGDLIIFRDPEWPMTEVLHLKWNFCKESELRRMLELIKLTLGQFIYYLDHENKQWNGVIQNPEAEGIQTGRESYEIELRFEGIKVT